MQVIIHVLCSCIGHGYMPLIACLCRSVSNHTLKNNTRNLCIYCLLHPHTHIDQLQIHHPSCVVSVVIVFNKKVVGWRP